MGHPERQYPPLPEMPNRFRTILAPCRSHKSHQTQNQTQNQTKTKANSSQQTTNGLHTSSSERQENGKTEVIRTEDSLSIGFAHSEGFAEIKFAFERSNDKAQKRTFLSL